MRYSLFRQHAELPVLQTHLMLLLIFFSFQAPASALCWISWRIDAVQWACLLPWPISTRSICSGSSCQSPSMSPVTGSICKRKWSSLDCDPIISIIWHWHFRSVVVGRVSHKVNDNFVMRIYYQKDVLTFMCCVNELFYVCLYLLHFTSGPLSNYIIV